VHARPDLTVILPVATGFHEGPVETGFREGFS